MQYLFELSKEHPTLPADEVLSSLNAEHISFSLVEKTVDVLVVTTSDNDELISSLSQRLSLSFSVNKLLFSSESEADILRQNAENHPIHQQGSLAVTYRNRSQHVPSDQVIKPLADVYTRGRTVDLNNPEIELHVIITDEKTFVGQLLSAVPRSQFEKRKAQHRPFFSPVSLHPKLARALVNLSTVAKDGCLLDPFCGTGGILIEAGLIGVTVYGGDIEEKMVNGCQQNLEYYGIKNYHLFNVDIGELPLSLPQQVDAVVTDFPYGKATTTKGETLQSLYDRAFQSITSSLKPDGKAVIGLPDRELIHHGKTYLHLENIYEVRVHRSLTRFFAVYQKQQP